MIQNIQKNIENKQRYIPGIEGASGITFFCLSSCKRYLAVCERANQALCVIYDMVTLKRKRILTSSESNSTVFVSASFAQSEDKMQ